MSHPVDNCRLQLEDREFLAGLSAIPRSFATFSRPDSVDVAWHHNENQGQIGSCQGNALSSCIERVEFVGKRPPVQLSRIFAYLATQQIDGLLGNDQGSTISGGGKLALNKGCCPEDLTGYPRSYPNKTERDRILGASMFEAAERYRVKSLWAVPEDPEEAKNWIGGGGAISLGILWPGMPGDRVMKSYSGGGGGHAVFVGGYKSDRLIAVNSWGDGPFEIMDNAWRQMMRHRWTAAVGLAGSTEPEPEDITIISPW